MRDFVAVSRFDRNRSPVRFDQLGGEGEGIVNLPMSWVFLSDSEGSLKRLSKETGWSLRAWCRIEYMMSNENAAEIGFVCMRQMNADKRREGMMKLPGV